MKKLFLPATAVVLFGAFALPACEKAKPKSRVPGSSAKVSTAPPETQFSEARGAIAAGRYAEAAETLQHLDGSGRAPAAIREWVTLYAGLAELLAGRETEARSAFARLAERMAGEPGPIGVFFNDLGTRLSGDKPIPSNIISRYDRQSQEVIALFLYALKNEQLESFDEALTFYRQFTTTAANGPEPWPGFNVQLKQFRQASLDLLEYEDLVGTATRARNVPGAGAEAARALEAARVQRKKVRRETKLVAQLDERLQEKVQMDTAMDEADSAVFPPARERWKTLLAACDFAGAKQAIFEPKVKSEKVKQEQERLGALAGNLEQFKFNFILELGSKGSDQPLTLKNGATVKGFTGVDDNHFQVRDAAGVKPTPWSEITPESLYALAKSLLNPAETPDMAAARKWHLGVFAAHLGKTEEARTFLSAAAADNPAYADEIPLILPPP